MATKKLQGNDWSVNGNWSDNAVPVTGDTAIVPESLNVAVDAGLDQGGVDLAALILESDKAVGLTGTPLKIAATLIVIRGGGNFFFSCDKNAGSGFKTDEIRIQCKNPAQIVEINSNAADAGDIDKIIALRGKVIIKGDTVFGASAIVEAGFIENLNSDLDLTIEDNGGTLATLEQNGGLVSVANILTNGRLVAGTLIKKTQKGVNLDIYGGTCNYEHAVVTGDGVTVKLKGHATLDMTTTSDVKVGTNLWLFPGGRFLFEDSLHSFTNTFNIKGSL